MNTAQTNLFDSSFQIMYNSILNPKQVFKLDIDTMDRKVIDNTILTQQRKEVKQYILNLAYTREEAYKMTGQIKFGFINPFNTIRKYLEQNQYTPALNILIEHTKNETSLATLNRIKKFLG